jgi:hypothetical protein
LITLDQTFKKNTIESVLNLQFLLFKSLGIKAAIKRSKYRQEPPEERLLKEQKKSSRDEMAARHMEREKKRVQSIYLYCKICVSLSNYFLIIILIINISNQLKSLVDGVLFQELINLLICEIMLLACN